MILAYAPNWSVIYDRKFIIVNLLKYKPQLRDHCLSLYVFTFISMEPKNTI